LDSEKQWSTWIFLNTMEQSKSPVNGDLIVTMPQLLLGLQHLEDEATAQLDGGWGSEK
jgi:hypothetical protein